VNKRKVVLITVTFDNGETDTFEVDATMSESLNARKKGGFANLQEWVEYHITWITYVQDLLPVVAEPTIEKRDRETLRGIAWCSQHGMEPGDCFAQHNPSTAFSGKANAYLSFKYPNFARQVQEAITKGVESIFPEFDISDLKEGYGNGNSRSH
jgi:hypothetical protein